MVNYSRPFLKLTFGGFQAGGQDEWNCGINLSVENDAPVPIFGENIIEAFEGYTEEMFSEMPDLISSYISSATMDVPREVTLDYVKLAAIGEDGLYLADSVQWDITGVTGGVSRAYVPQVSLVMTTQSDKRSDPGKFGRFYLPTAVPATSTGFRPVNTQAKAELTALLLSDLDRDVTTMTRSQRIRPAAVSSSEKITGQYLPITKVRVGNVFDTQRRRRNRIAETYVEASVRNPAPVPDPTP